MSLLKTCYELAHLGVPCNSYDDDGKESGHWTATKDDMAAFLGRDLTDAEVCCLSVSRNFGPTPGMSDEDVLRCCETLFPNGNGAGGWWEWDDMAKAVYPLGI